MKILRLLEMPQFRDSIPFFTDSFNKISIRNLESKFDEMVSQTVPNQYGFFIRKDLTQAIVVKYEKSEFEVRGNIIVELAFKSNLDIVWNGEEPSFGVPMLQVDGVANCSPKDSDIGLVSELYFLIADKFVLVSDNVHYQGGKALWIKIAKTCTLREKSVIVCDDGEIISDENSVPIKFNGSNLEEHEIWSSENSTVNKFFCLLMLSNVIFNQRK